MSRQVLARAVLLIVCALPLHPGTGFLWAQTPGAAALPKYSELIARSSELTAEQKSQALTFFKLGFDLWQSGDFSAAQIAFKQGLDIDPVNPQANYYYGDSLLKTKDRKGAADFFTRSAALGPTTLEGIKSQAALQQMQSMGRNLFFPSGRLSVTGGPQSERCSAFVPTVDLGQPIAASAVVKGFSLQNEADPQFVSVDVSGFTWHCTSEGVFIKLELSGIQQATGKRGLVARQTQFTFSAMECPTIECASRKFTSIFNPIVQKMAGEIAEELLPKF